MDKNILKKFAIESRQDLMKKIEIKLKTFYVKEEFSIEQKDDIYVLINEKHTLNLTAEQYKKRELLIKRIKELSLDQVIEEAAYTWFNRIVAIRYMEINDMLPLTKDNQSLGIRVLSSKDNTPDPEIMKFTNLTNPDLDINFNKEYFSTLAEDMKFEYILLLVCKKIGKVIPQVFAGVTDYIDILIPDNLLNDTGFINKVVTEVPETNFKQVEIIGWLYQYYNQTEKDKVISAKKVYMKTEIPYATQLFTPDWIVKYMVENSLGRYWLEHTTNQNIKRNWKYYIDGELENKGNIQPTEITFIDPCSGSGHILVYAFEIFYQIYQSVGYNKLAIPELILKNNLYGIDIDDRAGQLSILSVLLKAREYDKNIFNKNIVSNLNIISMQESKNIENYAIDILPENLKEKALYLKDTFVNAKEIGSLLLVENNDYSDLINLINKEVTIDTINLSEYLIPLIKQAKLLSMKYSVVVTNPPYINNKMLNNDIKNYLSTHYSVAKSDLFSAFIIRNSFFGINDAYLGYMTPNVWMFLSSYEHLRKYIIENLNISSFIQMAKGSFFSEATVDIISFVLNNRKNDENGSYIRLDNYKGNMGVQENSFLKIINSNNSKDIYIKNSKEFLEIPGSIIAYWVDKKTLESFSNPKIKDLSHLCNGLTTGKNEKFLRFWYEVNRNKMINNCESIEEAKKSEKKWFPYNKGGNFRKWYGNNDYIINWENDGYELKQSGGLVPRSLNYMFNASITWSKISSGTISFRIKEQGYMFDVAGLSLFPNIHENYNTIIGFCNSVVAKKYSSILSPTLNYEVGHISNFPMIIDIDRKKIINDIVTNSIKLSKQDWDSFETSWDFKKHPLIPNIDGVYDREDIERKNKKSWLSGFYENYEDFTNNQFNQLKANEEELNRIFIDIYGLQDELTPEVLNKDVTIRKADKLRDIKSLISYAVGCMFGRYSLDEDGLIYAGGKFDSSRYKTFKVDIYNVIPITDELYFTDDIVSKFKNFIEIVYGKETLNENMDFIAETLGKRGTETNEDTIRRYFNNDFYNDHIKVYKKKPIYWLFDSGKKNGFKALIYMHRYNDGLVAKVRLDYLHKTQNIYERLLNDISNRLSNDELDLNTKKNLQKQQVDLSNKLQETIEYDEKIAHIANQRINIDLDDGVTVNYSKFVYINPKTNKEESILAKIR